MSKTTKKALSILIAAAVLISICAFTVFAIDSNEMTLTVASGSGMPNDTVNVDFSIKNNPGISSLKVSVEYDEYLTLTGVEFNSEYGTYVTAPEPYTNPQVLNIISPLTEINANGTFATLTFEISGEAPDNYTANITVTHAEDDIFDGDYNNIPLNVENGSITIYHGIPGDINKDKVVNNKDAILLFRYVAGWNVNVDLDAVDVNGDNKVNNKDAITLFRYVAGWQGITLARGSIHTHELEHIEASPATCTEDGNVEYWHCSVCDKYFGDANGNTEITLESIVIPSTGHTVVIDEDVAPTYDTTGLTKGSHCSECNAVIVAQTVIPKLEATYYSIIYNNCKGATIDEKYLKYRDEEGLDYLPQIAADGYIFDGWYDVNGNKVTKIDKNTDSGKELFANWLLIDYTISYDLGNASNNINNREKYTIETESFSLADPTLFGYVFRGWYDSDGNRVERINKGTTGNIYLRPKWVSARNLAHPISTISSPIYKPFVAVMDGDNYFFVYYLGYIDNVVISNGEVPYYHNGMTEYNKGWSTKYASTESILKSISESTSQSTSWQKTDSVQSELATSIGLQLGEKDVAVVNGQISSKVSNMLSYSIGGTYLLSENEINSGSFSYNIESETTEGYSIDRDSPVGSYRLVNTCLIDVFAVVVYNGTNNVFCIDNLEYVRMYSKMLDYSTSNAFDDETDSELPFELSCDDVANLICNVYTVKYEGNKPIYEEKEINNLCSDELWIIDGESILPEEPQLEGWKFKGWFLDKECTEKIGDAGEILHNANLTNALEKTTLFAKWEPADNIVVSFNSQGGNEIIPIVVSYNSPYGELKALPEPVKQGYCFTGWILESGEKIYDSTIVKNPNPHFLIATWTGKDCAVKYHMNDDSGVFTVINTNVPVDDSIFFDDTIFEREGYIFQGWSISPHGEILETIDNNGIEMIDDCEIDLYAQWRPITYYYSLDMVFSTGQGDTTGIRTATYDVPMTINMASFGWGYSSDYQFSYWTWTEKGETKTSYSETITIKNLTTIEGQHIHIKAYLTKKTCFTGDTMVLNSQMEFVRLDSLKSGDYVMSWNSFEGFFEAKPISLFWNHGDDYYDVIKLNFSNGKQIRVVSEHGFFDSTLNKIVYINEENHVGYLGHSFAYICGESFENVVLESAEVSHEFSSCYSLRTACNDNAIVEGFLTLTFEDVPGFLTYFEYGDNYTFDVKKKANDIETYGLYTYEEWKDYVSYEEFVALNGQYLKIILGKGYLTIDDVFVLINGMR